MVSIFRYHEISESTHRTLNPLSESKLDALGEVCGLTPGQRHLDLACGKGEMLCRYALDHGTSGVGVDVHPPFISVARARAAELGVEGQIRFVEGDAADPAGLGSAFDVVSCIGATWIGGGLSGTLEIMRDRARPEGWLLVGEVFWSSDPPEPVRRAQETAQNFSNLAGVLERFEDAGLELVEMILASHEDWDRYQASQWLAVSNWVASHPDDPEAGEVARVATRERRSYLADLRSCMGWGVFVGRRATGSLR